MWSKRKSPIDSSEIRLRCHSKNTSLGVRRAVKEETGGRRRARHPFDQKTRPSLLMTSYPLPHQKHNSLLGETKWIDVEYLMDYRHTKGAHRRGNSPSSILGDRSMPSLRCGWAGCIDSFITFDTVRLSTIEGCFLRLANSDLEEQPHFLTRLVGRPPIGDTARLSTMESRPLM